MKSKPKREKKLKKPKTVRRIRETKKLLEEALQQVQYLPNVFIEMAGASTYSLASDLSRGIRLMELCLENEDVVLLDAK